MKVLVAGATGAIGRSLIKSLRLAGHTIFGMVRSQSSSAPLSDSGAEPLIADAFDASSVSAAMVKIRPDVIINELTSLPKHYTFTDMKAAAGTGRSRAAGGQQKLDRGGTANGRESLPPAIRRILVCTSRDLADEGEGFAYGASAAVAAGAKRYAQLEAMTLGRTEFEAVALRYGFFYGPGTWFISDGDVGEQVRQQQVPIIGHGQGVWSWIHIDDAADATVRALDCPPGAYNIVDDNPSEQRVWLTAFARYCGALAPPHLSERQALETAGPDAVYYATQLRGASNAKAKRELGFRPRPLQWLVRTTGTTDA
jgi:nucleoside-diphosphate-sugar epimerase